MQKGGKEKTEHNVKETESTRCAMDIRNIRNKEMLGDFLFLTRLMLVLPDRNTDHRKGIFRRKTTKKIFQFQNNPAGNFTNFI